MEPIASRQQDAQGAWGRPSLLEEVLSNGSGHKADRDGLLVEPVPQQLGSQSCWIIQQGDAGSGGQGRPQFPHAGIKA